MNMVEKVARAICEWQARSWGAADIEARDRWRGMARAAIEAMREPTTEMQQVVAAQWGRRTWAQYEEVIVAAIGGDENA